MNGNEKKNTITSKEKELLHMESRKLQIKNPCYNTHLYLQMPVITRKAWTWGDSNPRPKHPPLPFYHHSLVGLYSLGRYVTDTVTAPVAS